MAAHKAGQSIIWTIDNNPQPRVAMVTQRKQNDPWQTGSFSYDLIFFPHRKNFKALVPEVSVTSRRCHRGGGASRRGAGLQAEGRSFTQRDSEDEALFRHTTLSPAPLDWLLLCCKVRHFYTFTQSKPLFKNVNVWQERTTWRFLFSRCCHCCSPQTLFPFLNDSLLQVFRFSRYFLGMSLYFTFSSETVEFSVNAFYLTVSFWNNLYWQNKTIFILTFIPVKKIRNICFLSALRWSKKHISSSCGRLQTLCWTFILKLIVPFSIVDHDGDATIGSILKQIIVFVENVVGTEKLF